MEPEGRDARRATARTSAAPARARTSSRTSATRSRASRWSRGARCGAPSCRPASRVSSPRRAAARFVYVAASPVIIIAGVFAFIAVWNVYAWLGRPGTPVNNALGSRVAWIPLSAVAVAVIITQGFVPALSEHMSPRGVWAVVRALRHGNERVGRYGGPAEDPASRYYTTVQPRGGGDRGGRGRVAHGVGPALPGGGLRRVRSAQPLVPPRAARERPGGRREQLQPPARGERPRGRPSRNPLDAWVSTARPALRHAAATPSPRASTT